ncbi:MAG TPA: ABC transporter ATP-binding protein [Spirochaetia bacterium]|nr:MAG: hypothetical protein A2Y41_11820 [Spirochaetes bacterium GWB1_36_13]HCL56734.1 ABC transporter ATP-binding protein [Spirochaetia bacterium]
MEKILEIKNINKSFSGIKATQNVSFDVFKGEILGILGPNGAGKTTLFNQISGFDRPDNGEILYKGANIIGIKPHILANQGLARTFQLVRPFHGMTIRENLMVPFLSDRGKKILLEAAEKGKKRDDLIGEIASSVGLADSLDENVNNLPHGALKKLEAAKISAIQPEIIMLDEPFGGLTEKEIESLSEYVKFLNQEKGITFIIIEHRLREFMKLVNRVVALNYGEKIAEGVPEEIIKNQLVIEAYLGKGGAEVANSKN